MKKVIIIGSGFAGLTALRKLCRYKKNLNITIIDSSNVQNFLPVLPDVIGRGIKPAHLTFNLVEFCKKKGLKFLNEKVTAVDLEKKQVAAGKEILNYDYLVIACGSETNFYGNEQIKNNAYKLDSVADAQKLSEALNRENFEKFIIAGGGYTGLEVANNLKLYLDKRGLEKKVIIVERASSILGPLPQWMKEYALENLKRMDIEIITNTAIEKFEGRRVILQNGFSFENTMLIWAAGVKIADFVQALKAEKNPQGRVRVDKYLRLNESCFVIGDAAYVSHKNIFLRMAVQFAIYQGACAAKNIIRSIRGKSLHRYRPIDAGYIIPMANNRSCGVILGFNCKGALPTFMHYLMCFYRSYTLKNKIGIINDLFTRVNTSPSDRARCK